MRKLIVTFLVAFTLVGCAHVETSTPGVHQGEPRMSKPPVPEGPIVTLSWRVKPERRAEMLSVLHEAFPFYEKPGGIRMALFEDLDHPNSFLEVAAYADRVTYDADQVRVEKDPEMRAMLARWRAIVDGSVEVRRMVPVAP